MPIGKFAAGKSPLDVRPCQAARDVRIVEEIIPIIVVQKAEPVHRKIDGERSDDQKRAQETRAAKRTRWPGLLVHYKMKTNALEDFQRKLGIYANRLRFMPACPP